MICFSGLAFGEIHNHMPYRAKCFVLGFHLSQYDTSPVAPAIAQLPETNDFYIMVSNLGV